MKIIIKKIKNKNIYFGYLDPMHFLSISSHGIYFKKDDEGFNDFNAFVKFLKMQYHLKKIEIIFKNEHISNYDNELLNQLDPPF